MNIFNGWKSDLSREDVIVTIDDFLSGKGSDYDWGDFLCVSIKNKTLDGFRVRCNSLSEEYPPSNEGDFCNEEGLQELRNIRAELMNIKTQ